MQSQLPKIPEAKMRALTSEVQGSNLSLETQQTLVELLKFCQNLGAFLVAQEIKMEKLKRLAFEGKKTEKKKKAQLTLATSKATVPVAAGHGRKGASEYPGAERVIVDQHLQAGDCCPDCARGKLYSMSEASVLRFFGQALIKARVYELRRLRCSGCLIVKTAELPKEAGPDRHHPTASATVALLNYGSGLPFYRMEGLQANFGCPLSDATQFEMSEKAADRANPVYKALLQGAAQGHTLYHDDTKARILSLMKENESLDPKKDRTGVQTTGIVSELELTGGAKAKIALYFSGRNHAGENLEDLLKQRSPHAQIPIQVADAASSNFSGEFESIVVKCLDHGRRKFTDIEASFASECRFIIEKLGAVYHFDQITKDQKMASEERLLFHQGHSTPVMNELNTWMEEKLQDREVEENSELGQAIRYFLKHWNGLTQFLRVPGAPLSNAEAERVLKRCVLRRKASLFYRTEHGAQIGDILMSVIETARFAGLNIFEYLTDLQLFSHQVKANPEAWLPWNYKLTRAAVTAAG